MISECEGTPGDEGYAALFGYVPGNGPTFSDFSTHPDIRVRFTQTDGTVNWTTAAGKYQIIYPTFLNLQARLGTSDFGPATQDLMATALIEEKSAINDIVSGNLQAAINKCSTVWASLPDSSYPQPKKSYSVALEAYQNAGGTIA